MNQILKSEVTKVLQNGRRLSLMDLARPLPMTLEGLEMEIKSYCKKETVKTGRKIWSLHLTSHGYIRKQIEETIDLWSLK